MRREPAPNLVQAAVVEPPQGVRDGQARRHGGAVEQEPEEFLHRAPVALQRDHENVAALYRDVAQRDTLAGDGGG
ncbi:MAG TPA: hypothetical protein VFG47_22215, partial [Geminicoccaceae bacterium]|nr:hypothetical protein [Geminicoccaceae bacterium]